MTVEKNVGKLNFESFFIRIIKVSKGQKTIDYLKLISTNHLRNLSYQFHFEYDISLFSCKNNYSAAISLVIYYPVLFRQKKKKLSGDAYNLSLLMIDNNLTITTNIIRISGQRRTLKIYLNLILQKFFQTFFSL